MEVFFAVTVLIAFILAWGWFCLVLSSNGQEARFSTK